MGTLWSALGAWREILHDLLHSFPERLNVLRFHAEAAGRPRLGANDDKTLREVLIVPEQGYGSRAEPAQMENSFLRPVSRLQEAQGLLEDLQVLELEDEIRLRPVEFERPTNPVERFIDRYVPAARRAIRQQPEAVGRPIR